MNKLSALLLSLVFVSCSSNDIPAITTVAPAPEVQKVTEYHEKYRTKPYPLAESTIYVNPAPLIVPKSMMTGKTLQFQLSPDSTFVSSSTITSEPLIWCMYSPHRALERGKWFWRFRSDEGEWSQPLSFVITGEEDVFATPPFEQFLANAPRRHPRLNCFIDAADEQYRATAPSHPEYRALLSRADDAIAKNTPADVQALYKDYSRIRNAVTFVSDAYVITGEEKYASFLISLLEAMTANPPSDSQLFSANFATSAITYAYTEIYDLMYNRLSPAIREAAEQQMLRTLIPFTTQCIGNQENHIFDNHFWQHNMRIMFQAAFALFDNPKYQEQVQPLLQYYYELWCTRAPASGFTRDGLWPNGVGYMSANIHTLAYMPKLLSYITRFDFLSHPWYRNAGRSLCYSCPTGSMGVGFGDQSEKYTTTNRVYPAFADFLASETGDPIAGWYASQNANLVRSDYDLRLYRMTRIGGAYPTDMPAGITSMAIYRDGGEVAMHSDIADPASDLALAFRSSGYGSGSHTTASQNAFNLYYGGKPVFHSSGYYQNYSDAHNLMSYRHTRAHNSILINGIGQPYTPRAYGSLVRADGGSTISYALGDASNAYCGVTDDPMWINHFRTAGITQTPDNGFGETPLSRYRRHVAMLQGGIVVIYDELEATAAADWDWLLHSDTRFDISDGFTADVTSGASHSRVLFFTSHVPVISQTDEFVVPPAIRDEHYPNQWHLTARINGVDKVRYLTIILTAPKGDAFTAVKLSDDAIQIGRWTISAELDPSLPPSLNIVNTRTNTGLSLGSTPFVIGGKTYSRAFGGSTIIVDNVDGRIKASELVDITPANSRSAK